MMEVLIFNGTVIDFVDHDGAFYLAIKPMCSILNINYNRTYKNIKNHPTFSKSTLLIKRIAADSKKREMICLHEKYVYGWIYSIRVQKNSQSDLPLFQEVLYDAIDSHFKAKSNILNVKSK